MGKKLNRIEDDDIRWFIQHQRKTLAREMTGDKAPGALWVCHFALATHQYQQEAPSEEVRHHFLLAAENGVTAYEQVPPPVGGESRTPWDFGLLLGVVAAFGSDADQLRAAAIERYKWFYPETAPYMLQADCLEQFMSFLARRFDLDAAANVMSRCFSDTSDRDAVRFDGPMVQALVAIESRDQPAFQRAVGAMVQEHESRAMHGFLRTQTDGLVALLPLGLVRLGRDAGIDWPIHSPYVPVVLLPQ